MVIFVLALERTEKELKKNYNKMFKDSLKRDKDLTWYVFYTRSRTEKKVYERLVNLGYDAFLPLVTTIKQWSDRKKKVSEPLIKSFVFVKTSKNFSNEILNVSGVSGILKYLGEPAIVRDIEIENLKILVSNNECFQRVDVVDLTKGEEVEVVHGPFKGLYAKYLNNSGKHRIIVEVKALQSFIEVNLPLNTIKKI